MKRVWVVELLFRGEWQPTCYSVESTRADGRKALKMWKADNPRLRVRLQVYVSQASGRKGK